MPPYLLAEVAGLPDSYELPLSLVAVVVIFLVGLLVRSQSDLKEARAALAVSLKDHVDYVEAQVKIGDAREAASALTRQADLATIAKLTSVAEVITQQRRPGSGGALR